VRRTQEQRSAETRALLLDVTISCLAELGYAKTTAQVIADRAGLSRGAQLHHFGTRAHLVTAAMEHLFERGTQEFRAALTSMPEGTDPVVHAFDVIWKIMSGTTGRAYMELAWASRSDPELHRTMIEANRRNDEQVDAIFRDLFGDSPEASEYYDIIWTAVFALVEGLIIEKVIREDDDRIERVISTIRQWGPRLVTSRPTGSKT
jgi:AcrR family transcriptional regulator